MHREVGVALFLTFYCRVDGLFLVIISCLEKVKIIINAISMFYLAISFAFGIVSQSTNYSPNLVAEYLVAWMMISLKGSSTRADSNT
jgi:hypothetical protein